MGYTLEETILYVENLSIRYDGRDIIKNINMIEKNVVRPDKTTGQIIAIVGRSGRGKSTLFKALTGLVKPCTGQVLIPDPKDMTKVKVVSEGDVGFVDQKYTLFRNKTVKESLLFSLRNNSLPKEEKLKKINEYTMSWGLDNGLLEKYPNQLSGGQRQRVAILEQIFSSENFIIMDEPTSGLDVSAIEKMKIMFEKIVHDNEFNTIIFSTHNIEYAVEMADSIYVLGYPKDSNGVMEEYGTLVKNFDLKALGLAWTEPSMGHVNLIKEIKKVMIEH